MKSKPLAIVVLSGGMDSCVTAAIASEQFQLAFLHLRYGQRTQNRELEAFRSLVQFFRAGPVLEVDAPFFRQIGGSALTDDSIIIPDGGLNSTTGEIPVTYVPFRNANILCIAVSWAEVIRAKGIFIGAVDEDSSGYPDCRESFFKAFNQMVILGTKPDSQIQIFAPLLHLKKSEIVEKGVGLGAPFHLTWSCYRSCERACGVCDSCRLRLKGFSEAGVKDPIQYSNLTNV